MENNRYTSMIEEAQAGLDTQMPYFLSYYAAYNALLESDVAEYLKANGKSHLPVHYIMNKLQRIRADFVEGYFSNKQFAKINEKNTANTRYFNPVTKQLFDVDTEQLKESVKALQNAVDYYTIDDEDLNLFQILTQCFDHLMPYGTAALKVTWDKQRDGLEIENIDIKDIMFDRSAKSFKDAKYLVHNVYLTIKDIQDYVEAGVFDSKFDINKIGLTDNRDDASDEFKRHKLQEIYEIEDGKWLVTTVYDKDLILREQKELPFGNPIIVGKLKNRLHNPDELEDDNFAVRVYGDAIIAPLVSIQREMTVLRNQQIDIVNRQLNPRYISDDNKLNPFDFANQNLSLIKGDPGKTKELKTPDLRDSNFNVDRLSIEGQEAIGVTDYNSGTSNNKQINDTATGISILTTESNKILAYYMRSTNETIIKPLFKKITQLVWAYGSPRFFYGINRDKRIEYTVGVNVGLGATNPQQRLNGKMAAYKGMLELAQMMQDPKRLQNAEKFYYEEIMPLLGVENYEEYNTDDQTQENPVL